MPKQPTKQKAYTNTLVELEQVWWKRLLNVQAPYKWNVNRLCKGLVLDVGCGIGRNLSHLGDRVVGVDHNAYSIALCRQRGFVAFTEDEFLKSRYHKAESFDTLLLSHVLEHMIRSHAVNLILRYRKLLKKGARIVIITPQEAGFHRHETHVEFMDFSVLGGILRETGFKVHSQFSFPFPRLVGRIFPYNEFIVVGKCVGFELE